MPYRHIAGTATDYFLVAVDEEGIEQSPDPDWQQGPISERAIQSVLQDRISDVFIWCHGWKGDMNSAVDQFNRWIGAFAARTDDRKQMLERQAGFKELHIGYHWPSLAWGNESLAPGDSFAAGPGTAIAALESFHAKQLGDSPAVRAALHKLFDELRSNAAETTLTEKAREAYLELDQALALGDGGQPGDGGADRVKFDPDQAMNDDSDTYFGAKALGNKLLAPLRQLTFWTMKKRAKNIGESGLHPLIARLQASSAGLRIHLMGHSFGCIVMSSALAGQNGNHALPRPVDSCVLVQGATSLWAFAETNPVQSDVSGYFSKILANKTVRGPLVTTQSRHDDALGKIYPFAAGVANQIAFDFQKKLPHFGAIGIHGICGIQEVQSLVMNAQSDAYQLLPGCVYNVDASQYICKPDGMSGAHSDIDGPEVAHLIWQAAMPMEVTQ